MATVATRRNDDKNKITLPPRRGQIKAQIFESMVKTASAAVSKAGALLLGAHKPSSATSTPDNSPAPSNYSSDGAANNLP